MISAPAIKTNILTTDGDPSFLERFKQLINNAEIADIAAGYLFMSGFQQVASELTSLQSIRLLIGRTDRHTLDAVAAGIHQAEALRARVEEQAFAPPREREAQKAAASRTISEGIARLPQTDQSEQAATTMRDMIASNRLTIRAWPRGLLHAKAYICKYPPSHGSVGQAIVGSSNFTLAGFQDNTELNVLIQNDNDVDALARWFEELWDDSVEVTEACLQELNRSWPLAKTPPYHVYLKVLYELFRDELDQPAIEPPKRGTDLANFQLEAVRNGLAKIDRHGGCFIGDVVGLGKSYIGAELVRQLQLVEPAGRHPLIVCPAGLKPMWESISEQFGLGAEVVSMSAIRPSAGLQWQPDDDEYVEPESDEPGLNLLERYPERGVVLVDEVHNFRNANTRRYHALSEYLWTGDRKVILLSATPQNIGPRDVYNQLRLFLDETNHGLPTEPVRLLDYFHALEKWYRYKAELDAWKLEYEAWQLRSTRPGAKRERPPAHPDEPDGPYATLDQVLGPVFIRRRRKDIKDLYGDSAEIDGRPVRFPTPRLSNLDYRLDRVYEKAIDFERLKQLLTDHMAARYRALDYLTEAARHKPEYVDLLRARTRVAALMKVLLVKRLESSVAAFRSTIDTLMTSNRNFRESLTQGFVPIGKTATAFLGEHDFDAEELLVRLKDEEQRRKKAKSGRSSMAHPTADFDTERWIVDLDTDYAILSEICDKLALVSPEDDDKLQRLKEFLARPEVASGKVLIFSEAAATIDYLYQQLDPDGTNPVIAKLSGENHDSIGSVVKRFAPTANLRPGEPRPKQEIRLLLATDVVSEGQNMQDCNRVLNYDLHWNPVRLIQRFGRVDRIGTHHEEIFLHNTLPDFDLNFDLKLTDRLGARIQAFHDMIGLDDRLLSETERINDQSIYSVYDGKQLPEDPGDDPLDDVAAHQRGLALLQQMAADNPDLWGVVTSLPDGIRSAMHVVGRFEPDGDSVAGLSAPASTIALEGAGSTDGAPEDAGFGVLSGGPSQASLLSDVAQLSLMSATESAAIQTPMDAPGREETVVLMEQDGAHFAYAVGHDFKPRHVTPTQLVRAVACEPDTPAQPLPKGTNQRVMAAFEQAKHDSAAQLGRAARSVSDTKLRRHITAALRRLREQAEGDADEIGRINVLRRIYMGDLPPRVVEALNEVRRLGIDDASLQRRLESLRQIYRLAPADDDEVRTQPRGVLRIVCSDGFV